MPYGSGGRFGGGLDNPNYGWGGGNYYTGNRTSPGSSGGGATTFVDSSQPYTPGNRQSSDQFWTLLGGPDGGRWFNSMTGEYRDIANRTNPNRPEGNQSNDQSDPFWWMRNMRANMGSTESPEFIPWEGGGGYQSPEGWTAPESEIPEAGVDIRAIVESRRHFLDEEMGGRMADSARKLGGAGMLMSSDYVDQLGEAERSRDMDLASLYYDYDYRAAQSDADRRSTARENMLNRDLSAWGTHGGWENQGDMFSSGQDFQAWLAENQWNQSNSNNQSNEQMAWLQTIMPLLMAGGGENINWGQFWN